MKTIEKYVEGKEELDTKFMEKIHKLEDDVKKTFDLYEKVYGSQAYHFGEGLSSDYEISSRKKFSEKEYDLKVTKKTFDEEEYQRQHSLESMIEKIVSSSKKWLYEEIGVKKFDLPTKKDYDLTYALGDQKIGDMSLEFEYKTYISGLKTILKEMRTQIKDSYKGSKKREESL